LDQQVELLLKQQQKRLALLQCEEVGSFWALWLFLHDQRYKTFCLAYNDLMQNPDSNQISPTTKNTATQLIVSLRNVMDQTFRFAGLKILVYAFPFSS
jgi:hypothetical protein